MEEKGCFECKWYDPGEDDYEYNIHYDNTCRKGNIVNLKYFPFLIAKCCEEER